MGIVIGMFIGGSTVLLCFLFYLHFPLASFNKHFLK